MRPASSRARTRRRHGGGEMPTRRASSILVILPSLCSRSRIRRSIRSSFGPRMRCLVVIFRMMICRLRNDDRDFATTAQFCCALWSAPRSDPPGLPRRRCFRKPEAWSRCLSPPPTLQWSGRLRSSGFCTTARPAWPARRSGSPRRPVSHSSKNLCRCVGRGAGRRRRCGSRRCTALRIGGRARLTPPWPDAVIGCGRNAVRPALAIKRASGGRTIAAHIQDPRFGRDRFDLMIVPRHDRLRGPRVLVTEAAVHRVTPAAARRRVADAFRRSQLCRGRSSAC